MHILTRQIGGSLVRKKLDKNASRIHFLHVIDVITWKVDFLINVQKKVTLGVFWKRQDIFFFNPEILHVC